MKRRTASLPRITPKRPYSQRMLAGGHLLQAAAVVAAVGAQASVQGPWTSFLAEQDAQPLGFDPVDQATGRMEGRMDRVGNDGRMINAALLLFGS